MQDLVDRVESLIVHRRRVLIGIAGPPGSGKSTLAERLEQAFNTGCDPSSPRCRVVPMDGFHLSDAALTRLGRLDRKGAIDTFDAWGYRAMLERLRNETDHVVFAPSFERELEEPIAAGIVVEPSVELVISEGNYLLVDTEPWSLIRSLFDEVWFCRLDPHVRVQRLVQRHVEFGKSPDEARAWVRRVDEPNAAAVDATAGYADLVVDIPG